MDDELTNRQKEIYRLRHSTKPEMPFEQMASLLGMTKGGAHRRYHETVRKMKRIAEKKGLVEPEEKPELGARPGSRSRNRAIRKDALEHVDPELAAAVMEERTHALRPTASALARQYGVPVTVFQKFLDRIDKQYAALTEEVRAPQLKELVDLTGARAKAILQSITPEDIEQATLRDKAVAVGIFVEKHLLLEGRPTQIVETREEDQALDKVIGWVLQEAQRRGLTFDLDPVTGAINPIMDAGTTSRGEGSGRQHLVDDGTFEVPPGG
jgi:nucleotide-binding universal stress UspA family protein